MKASNSLKPTNGSWQREGQVVKALYIKEYPCYGEIKDSRVAYGGKVKHSLKLLADLELPFCRVDGSKTYKAEEYIGIDEESIIEVLE